MLRRGYQKIIQRGPVNRKEEKKHWLENQYTQAILKRKAYNFIKVTKLLSDT